jgi:hypothetical protein
MLGKWLIILMFLNPVLGYTQRFHFGVSGGAAAYNGDLTDEIFPKKVTNGFIGISFNYEVNDQILIRIQGLYSVVGGSDRFSKDSSLRVRNLSFETVLMEGSILAEYYLLNLYERKLSPYFFTGLALYHFDPYTYDGSNQKVYLKPLSTEGQGLPGYNNPKPYSLTQLAIPIGGGIKFALSPSIRIGIEGGLRKLFTDYLDDVSTNYADENDLRNARGQLAVDLSYRADEAGGSVLYPAKGEQRGSPKNKDYYYFTGIHLTYKVGQQQETRNYKKAKFGCPVVY